MVALEQDTSTGDRRIILRPNASLTPRQAWLLLIGIALVMAAIAISFAMLGLWLVLPFSGAEWVVLVVCFRLSFKACSVQEVITITDSIVTLEQGRIRPEQTFQFQRAWMSLDWIKPTIHGYPSRLAFRLHGKQVEIGRFLAESEREALARELQQILVKTS